MPLAHIECRPVLRRDDRDAGSFVVCEEHGLRVPFGAAYPVAKAACVEHNAVHHRAPATTPLASIVYQSRAAHRFGASDLDRLIAASRVRNRAAGVTGVLLAEQGWFLQALEGPAANVDALMHSIRRDPRHTHVHVLAQEERMQRRFPDWAMARGHIRDFDSLPAAQYYEAILLARAQTRAEHRARVSTARPTH